VNVETTSGGISELIGPAFVVFLPLVLLMRSRRRLFLHVGLYCLVMFALIYWTGPRPRTRYFLPVMPATAALVGAGLVFLRRYSRPAFWIGRAVVLLTVATGLAVAALYGASFAGVVFHLTPRDRFLARSTDFYGEYRWMNANTPPDAKILIQATNDLYYSPRPSMRLGLSSAYTHCDSGAVFALDAAGTPDRAFARMRELGITHIFTGGNLVSDASSSAGRILGELLSDGRLEKVLEGTATRGTRNPLASQREEHVEFYSLVQEE
jgi:hypothetical protein